MDPKQRHLVLAGFRSGWAASSLQLAAVLEEAGPPPNGGPAEKAAAWLEVVASIRRSASTPPPVVIGTKGEDFPDGIPGECIFMDTVQKGTT